MGPTDTGGAGAICARKISVSLFDHIFVYFVFIYFLPNVTYLLYIIACIMLWVTEISKYLQTVWDKLDIKFHTSHFHHCCLSPNKRCKMRYYYFIIVNEIKQNCIKN